MGIHTNKIILSVILLVILINPVNGQDYNYEERNYMFSEHLKEGMEFTWEFKKYSVNLNDSSIGFDQVTSTTYANVTEEYTTVSTTTTTTEEHYPVETVTETTEVYIEYPEFPEVPIGTLYTVKLLKDLANLTEDYFYYDYDNEYENRYKEYFDISVSMGDPDPIISFFSVDGFLVGENSILH